MSVPSVGLVILPDSAPADLFPDVDSRLRAVVWSVEGGRSVLGVSAYAERLVDCELVTLLMP